MAPYLARCFYHAFEFALLIVFDQVSTTSEASRIADLAPVARAKNFAAALIRA
jgi:hypothetical protein